MCIVKVSSTVGYVCCLFSKTRIHYIRFSNYSFGFYRTLRYQDTSDPHETLQRPSQRHCCTKKRATRHFGIRSTKSRDTLDPGQFRHDTAPPVIRLKVGAEVSWCRNVLWPKCPAHIHPTQTTSTNFSSV